MAESKDPTALEPPAAEPRAKRHAAAALLRHAALAGVRYQVQQAAPLPTDGKLCYVLDVGGTLDRLLLVDACERNGWPQPVPLGRAAAGDAVYWSVRSVRGWPRWRVAPRDVGELEPLVASDATHGGTTRVYFVPVAIFWGRAPAREQSLIEVLFSEDWAVAGRVRRFFALLVHGRDVLVKCGEPLAVADLAAEDKEDATVELAARKAARLLRVFFTKQRELTIGPDLSHRRLLLDEVLDNPMVTAAIRRDVRASGRSERRVRARARKYANEIAADYSYPVVRVLDRVLGWLWNRLYDGVDVRHIERLEELAAGSELVYMPCHRSHIDYMLLSYVIYRRGLAPPHIAAGLNLNLPLIGPILRRGGAFFLRRSFQGNALYTAVFRSYFRTILARGFPIEFFVEGTRSRTGRLLNPKLGMLEMTVQSFVLDRKRPIVFVPVYIGYEKLIEGQTFIGELAGARKRKETLGGFFRSLGALRERFGSVQLSFGAPLVLEQALDEVHPDWRRETLDEQFRAPWMSVAAATLGRRIMTSINSAAVLNPVNLVALVVLGMPKRAIVEVELRAQLELYIELARLVPYADRIGTSDLDADAMIAYCERMRWLARRPHTLGDVLHMSERQALLASYYRNNVQHVFALPALVAAAFTNHAEISTARLKELIAELYSALRSELFLRLRRAEVATEVERVVDAMLDLGLLGSRAGFLTRPPDASSRAAQLARCADIVQPFLERYYLCITVLCVEGSGALSARELVKRCRAASEQLALVYTLESPDLFAAGLFENWIAYLEEAGLISDGAEGTLTFDEAALGELAACLAFVIPPQIEASLRNLAGAATRSLSGETSRPSYARDLKRSGQESARSRAE